MHGDLDVVQVPPGGLVFVSNDDTLWLADIRGVDLKLPRATLRERFVIRREEHVVGLFAIAAEDVDVHGSIGARITKVTGFHRYRILDF